MYAVCLASPSFQIQYNAAMYRIVCICVVCCADPFNANVYNPYNAKNNTIVCLGFGRIFVIHSDTYLFIMYLYASQYSTSQYIINITHSEWTTTRQKNIETRVIVCNYICIYIRCFFLFFSALLCVCVCFVLSPMLTAGDNCRSQLGTETKKIEKI